MLQIDLAKFSTFAFDVDGMAEADTIHGLAGRKNRYVLDCLAREGLVVHDDAVGLLRWARALGCGGQPDGV